MARVTLRDGQWADLRERITHGQDKLIRRAYLAAGADIVEGQTVMLRQFIRAWKMNDPDGTPISLDDPDAIDRMPEDIADILKAEAQKHYGTATVPNPPTPSPSDGSS